MRIRSAHCRDGCRPRRHGPTAPRVGPDDLTVNALILAFWKHAEGHYGKPRSQVLHHRTRESTRRSTAGACPLRPIRSQGLRAARATDGDETERDFRASFEQEHGATGVGLARWTGAGAFSHAARRALKCAESSRMQDVAWPSLARTGRPGV